IQTNAGVRFLLNDRVVTMRSGELWYLRLADPHAVTNDGAEDRIHLVIDAAMNDLIRPTLYEAYHQIMPVRAAAPDAPVLVADVVGPVCETGDYLALGRNLPEP
ncbi:hypothetical protein ACTGWW_11080, partial [Streptococcus suis]